MGKKFIKYYVVGHLVLLSLIGGWSAWSFTVTSGGGIAVSNPVSDPRAIVGNNTINSFIAAATSSAYLRQAKRIAGGCEMWESTDFFRIDRWGMATSSPNPVSSMTCNCPVGFTKVQIRTRTENIKSFSSGNWYNRFSSWSGNHNEPVVCGAVNSTAAHVSVNSCSYQVIGLGAGYNKFCFKTLCNQGCDCSSLKPCDDQQVISRHDNFFDFVFKIKPVMAAGDDGCIIGGGTASGCGLVMMCQYDDLAVEQPTDVTTWLCVNTGTNSLTGWLAD